MDWMFSGAPMGTLLPTASPHATVFYAAYSIAAARTHYTCLGDGGDKQHILAEHMLPLPPHLVPRLSCIISIQPRKVGGQQAGQAGCAGRVMVWAT